MAQFSFQRFFDRIAALIELDKKPMRRPLARTWIEISKAALLHNLAQLSAFVAPVPIMSIIKSNAYGHDLIQTAKLIAPRVAWFGVDSLDEALTLRAVGIKKPILVLDYILPSRLLEAINKDISFTIYNKETLEVLKRLKTKLPAKVHIEIETGLSRQGVFPEHIGAYANTLKRLGSRVIIEGASMHFANVEDTQNLDYAHLQLTRFRQGLDILATHGIKPRMLHTAASAAALLLPEARFDIVRIGIMQFGLWPSNSTKLTLEKEYKTSLNLIPALELKTVVAQVKTIQKGEPVSYGLTERVTKNTRLAVLPVGYFDGIDRKLSSRGHVLIRGKRCKILGRVCMNMCMVDASRVSPLKPNEIVTIIGRDMHQTVTADELAQDGETIHYEFVTRLHPSIPRFFI